MSPFAGLIADAIRANESFSSTELVRIVLVGAVAACVYAEAHAVVVYGLAIAATIAVTPFRSAQAALLRPSPAARPADGGERGRERRGEPRGVRGPALAGLVLAATSIGATFVVTVALLVVSAFFVVRIEVERKERTTGDLEARRSCRRRSRAFARSGRYSSLRVMMVLLTAQTAIAGLVQVYIVVVAIELLELGEGGVGFINSAIGIGALIGAILAFALTGVRRPARRSCSAT